MVRSNRSALALAARLTSCDCCCCCCHHVQRVGHAALAGQIANWPESMPMPMPDWKPFGKAAHTRVTPATYANLEFFKRRQARRYRSLIDGTPYLA